MDHRKNIIVTGATGNLGQATVTRLLADGHRVIATTINAGDENTPDDLFEKHRVDLADEQAASTFVDGIAQKHQVIHAAMLLVGGYAGGDIRDTGSALIRKMIALNFETAYHVARPVFNQMMRQPGGGRIVLVGARPALKARDAARSLAYGLSKSLVLKLAEILNAEGAAHDVVTTVIVPSTIDTPENRAAMPDADFTKWVSPEDIAAAIAFMLSQPALPLRETVLKMYGKA